ncbi:MAG: cysteine desulfurase family protein [Acidimicrobiales bacterium]|nr:cysteine desulfurase family protein [Acidimicrobiales bacterium]
MNAYLDHAATTPMCPEARAAMAELLDDPLGNPTGSHRGARAARKVVDEARDVMAAALGCAPGEVVFTSGGTEADNLAVRGVVEATGTTVLCSAIEHHAVLDPVVALGGRALPVDRWAGIDLDALAAMLDDSVGLVSVMLANNEIGVIQDLEAVATVIAEHAPHAVLHTDAVQAFPWLDVATFAAPARLVSISAHKFGGPQGVGALVVRNRTPLAPQQLGGGQERGLRSGTHNVAGIGAMAAAAAAVVAERATTVERVARLRDRLADGLSTRIPDVVETAVGVGPDGRPDRSNKVAASCHVCIDGVESEALLFMLDQAGVAASAASSCSSGALDPSHVLAALGVPRDRARGSLRLSLGATTTDAEVDHAVDAIVHAVDRLRSHR